MTIDDQIATMKQYLLMKYQQEDWHGVMDAAADIRELLIRKNHISDVSKMVKTCLACGKKFEHDCSNLLERCSEECLYGIK